MNQTMPVIDPRVLAICRASPSNTAFTTPKFVQRFILADQMSRLRVLDGLLYSWCRVPWKMDATADAIDLSMNEGQLWVLDLIFVPDVTPMQAMRRTAADLLEEGIGKASEDVMFYREGPKRYGHVRI